MTHNSIQSSFEPYQVTRCDPRSGVQRFSDRGYSTACYVAGFVQKLIQTTFSQKWIVDPCKFDPNKRRLYVLIHGLEGSPSGWKPYVERLSAQESDGNYFVYSVPEKGNCGLKSASTSLIDWIDRYVQKYPQTETIFLLGKSNGSRIAARVERKLVHLRQRIHTVSMAGVHQGTRMMECAKRLFRFHPKLMRDLEYRGDRALELLDKWRASTLEATGKRTHAFYVSSEDESVVPFESGLVRIGAEDSHFICHGYTHRNLANSICDQVLQHCASIH